MRPSLRARLGDLEGPLTDDVIETVRAAAVHETGSAELVRVLADRHPELRQVFEGVDLHLEVELQRLLVGGAAQASPPLGMTTPVAVPGGNRAPRSNPDDPIIVVPAANRRQRTRKEAAADAISILARVLCWRVREGKDVRRKVDSMRELLAHLHPESAPDLARLHTAQDELMLVWDTLDRIRRAVDLEEDADADDIAEAVERFVERAP